MKTQIINTKEEAKIVIDELYNRLEEYKTTNKYVHSQIESYKRMICILENKWGL